MAKIKKLPRVAIAGKRNAGKSTLLNAMLGQKRAITHDTPGLTRDILEVEIEWSGLHFKLCDTPGLDLPGDEPLAALILKKTRSFLEKVDVTIFLMEPPAPTPFDVSFLEYFRRENLFHKIIFALNKTEKPSDELSLSEFYAAGFPEMVTISALGKKNLPILYTRIAELAPSTISRKEKILIGAPKEDPIDQPFPDDSNDPSDEARDADSFRAPSDADIVLVACIVGKPNAGKSSLLNKLTGQELSLVSEIPGTTRDTVDAIFLYHGKKIKLVDTAGLRPQGKITDSVEFFSASRTKKAIERSQVVIHVVDATTGITDFDKKIVSLADEAKTPMVFAVNKWDAVEEKDMKAFLDRLYFFFPHAKTRPVIFCSAVTGVRVSSLIEESLLLKERVLVRIPTPRLNDLITQWNRKLSSAPRKGKIYFATQSSEFPPEFIFFVNDKSFFRKDIVQFFENQIRKEVSLEGVPIRILLREKNADKGGSRSKVRGK